MELLCLVILGRRYPWFVWCLFFTSGKWKVCVNLKSNFMSIVDSGWFVLYLLLGALNHSMVVWCGYVDCMAVFVVPFGAMLDPAATILLYYVL